MAAQVCVVFASGLRERVCVWCWHCGIFPTVCQRRDLINIRHTGEIWPWWLKCDFWANAGCCLPVTHLLICQRHLVTVDR